MGFGFARATESPPQVLEVMRYLLLSRALCRCSSTGGGTRLCLEVLLRFPEARLSISRAFDKLV